MITQSFKITFYYFENNYWLFKKTQPSKSAFTSFHTSLFRRLSVIVEVEVLVT